MALTLLGAPQPAEAQQRAAPPQAEFSRILTLNMDQLLEEAALAVNMRAQGEAIRLKLRAETESRDMALKSQEQALVALRDSLTEDKAALTNERAALDEEALKARIEALNARERLYSERVRDFEEDVRILRRDSQANGALLKEAMSRAMLELREALRPVLQDIMRDYGATHLLDETQLLLSDSRFNITGEAIRRLDALGGAITVKFPPDP